VGSKDFGIVAYCLHTCLLALRSEVDVGGGAAACGVL